MDRPVVAVAVAVLLLGSGGAVAAEYTVSVDDAMEVPDRTVSIAGETYQISSLARVARGDPLTAQTAGPDGEGYRVYVHDAQGTVVDQRYVFPDDDGAVSFDTSPYEAGTYTVSAYRDGAYYDPSPVVVPAYGVSAAVPSRVGVGDTVSIAVNLTEREADHAVHGVVAVVSNETMTRRYEADEAGDEYVVDVAGGELSPGNYSVYAVATGTDEFPGPTNELIGVSDNSTLTVASQQASGPDGETGQSSAENGADANETAGPSGGTSQETESTTAADAANGSDAGSDDTEANETDSEDAVLSPEPPANETGAGAETTDDAGGVPFALLALLAVVGLLALRGPR